MPRCKVVFLNWNPGESFVGRIEDVVRSYVAGTDGLKPEDVDIVFPRVFRIGQKIRFRVDFHHAPHDDTRPEDRACYRVCAALLKMYPEKAGDLVFSH